MLSYGKQKLRGTVVPLITPLLDPETPDTEGLRNMIEHVIDGGVSGIFVLGSTGEGPALPHAVRRQVVTESVRITSGRCTLLVNVSGDSPLDSIGSARFAEAAGADAVVASPPCYLPLNDAELTAFYQRLSESVRIPVYVYNMPELTNVKISMRALEKILPLPNIAGIKDSSGDMGFFKEILTRFGKLDGLSIFMGPDALTRQALLLGADGGVNSGANWKPEVYSGLCRAAADKKEEEMERCQRIILDVQNIYKCRSGSPGVIRGLKKVLADMGLIRNILAFPGENLQ